MKPLLFFLVTIACLTATGQKNSSSKRPKQIFIGFNFSPDYDYRSLNDNGSGSSDGIVVKVRNDMEVAKFGFTTGLNLRMHVKKMIGFEAGIQYSNKGYQTPNHDLVFAPPDPSLPIKAQTIFSYHYIDIPLKLDLAFGENNIHCIAGAGFAMNFLVSATLKNTYQYADGRTEKKNTASTDQFKKFNLSPFISLGAECKINNKAFLRIEPTFRYGLLKTTDTPVTEQLWNAGLNIGLYYSL